MHDFTNEELFALDTLLMAYEAGAGWAGTTCNTTNLVSEGLVEMDQKGVFCRLTPFGIQVAKDARQRAKPAQH